MKIEIRKEDFEAMQQNVNFFETLLNASTDGIVITDEKQNIVGVNDSFCRYFRQFRQDLLNTSLLSWLEQLNPTGPFQWLELEKTLRQEGAFVDMGFQGMGEMGKRDFSINGSLVNRGEGEKGGIVISIWSEITRRKQTEKALQESESRLRLITDSVPAYVALVGIEDQRYRFVNQRFVEFFGLPRDKIEGSHIREIIGEGNYEFLKPYFEKVRRGEAASYENTFFGIQGQRWIQVNYVPQFDDQGEVVGVVVLSLDITARKESEKALKESEKKLREANASKDRFFSILAHDLRGPLSGLLGGFKILSRCIETGNSTQIQTVGKGLHNTTQHVFKLLENLLEWSRVQQGMIAFQPREVDLFETAHTNVLYLFMEMARQKEIEINSRVEPDTLVYADPNMVETITRNLVANALKFTKPGGVVEIAAREEGVFVAASVSDTGIGLKEKEMDKLFRIEDKFNNLSTRTVLGSTPQN